MKPATGMLILAMLLIAGCGGDAHVAEAGTGAAEDAALSPQVVRELLEKRQECSLASFKRSGHGGADYPRILIGKVSVDQVEADARKHAAEQLRFFQRINPAQTEYARLENSIHAIGEAAAVTAGGEEAQLKAMALSAYYESLVTGADCPMDERILRLVHD